MRFENAFAAAPLTAPSHATIMTARFPHQHRVWRNGSRLRGRNPLARAFTAAGYRSAGFTGVRFLSELEDGFSFFDGSVPGRRPGREVSRRVRAWVAGRPPAEKLFLWVHLYDVHEWRHASRHHRPDVERVRAATALDGGGLLAWLERAHGLRPRAFPERRPAIAAIDGYDGRIRYVDARLRELFADLEQREGESLWVITSDHGEGLGSHDHLGHRQLYQEQLRVPLILFFSEGRHRGETVPALVRLVDLLPTLAELAGVALPALPREGESFAPLLEGRSGDYAVTRSFAEFARHSRTCSLHDLEQKLILHHYGRFFDLVRDPLELSARAQAASPRGRELADELRALRRRLAAAYRATPPEPVSPRHREELRAIGYAE